MNAAPNFDGLARIYRWMELASFGPALWRCRCHFLGELQSSRKALVLGDGDGRFTARLLEVNPEIRVDAVDASPAMLRALMGRAGQHSERVRTFCADVRTWEPAGRDYDLIVSHFFLDCLTTEEVAGVARRLRSYISPEVKWLVSEFAVPQSWFGRTMVQPVVSGLYLAFRGLTKLQVGRLPDYREVFEKEKLICQRRQDFLNGMLVAEVWSAGSAELLHSC